jgi:hypothetical protein
MTECPWSWLYVPAVRTGSTRVVVRSCRFRGAPCRNGQFCGSSARRGRAPDAQRAAGAARRYRCDARQKNHHESCPHFTRGLRAPLVYLGMHQNPCAPGLTASIRPDAASQCTSDRCVRNRTVVLLSATACNWNVVYTLARVARRLSPDLLFPHR